MAVTITEARTIFDQLDAVGSWTGTPTLFTSSPTPAEASGCLGWIVSNTTLNVTLTSGSRDLSSSLIYVWTRAFGYMDSYANGGVGIIIGDGTNTMAYYVGGYDQGGFRHASGAAEWICFILDTASLPTGKATIAGSEGSMSWTAITTLGIRFKTTYKAVGGVDNCFADIYRYGTSGLTITGGGTGTEGDFSEIAAEDEKVTDQKAFGICRELASGAFGLQGPLTFGDSGGTGSVDFESVGETVIFEPPPAGVANSRFWVDVVSNGTGTTSFVMTDGALICPTGTGAEWDSSDTDVETVLVTGTLIKGFEQGVTLSGDATNGPNHDFKDCTFDGCGQIDPGRNDFTNNIVKGSTVAADSSAIKWALNLDPDGYLDGLDITKGSAAHHAIEFGTASPLTLNLKDMVFSGFNASDSQNDSTFHVLRTSGTVTINLTDCTGNASYKSAGATVVVQNTVTLKVTVKDELGVGIVSAQTAIYKQSDDTELMNEDTIAGGIASESYNYSTDTDVYIRVRKSSTGSTRYKNAVAAGTITSTGLDVTITLIEESIS